MGAYLAASDRALARTALADARRVRRTLDERNRSYDESVVAEEIATAADALARGERQHDRSAPAAIAAYRKSWLHAQRALDAMDRAVEPTVSLDSRRDPPRNGTASYLLRGSVFDVRSHELDPLALTLDGETYRVALDADTAPGSVGRFAVNLTLAPGSHRVRVTATDPNRDWADGDAGPPANGSVLLRLDGDGLPDRFEAGVVGSDPLDPDSNASATARNESGNGVLDGLEDHDRDGAATYDEHVQGTDPLDSDTDGDDLPDGFELRYASLDLLSTDTDGDGVPDARENPDDDTLTIAAELANWSSPFYADTDADGIRDDAELRNGTDPAAPDTDGLSDAEEMGLPTDPADPDTDGDGVPDGEETFTTSAENESVGAAVNVTGEGNVADGVTIENASVEQVAGGDAANATVSSTVEFEADREFDNATLSLSYDKREVADENESDLAVYRWNHDRQTFVQVESDVNRSAGTVTAETEHFSTYTVLNSEAWGGFERTQAGPEYAVDENFGGLSGWNCDAGTCRSEDGSAVIGVESSASSSDAFTVDGEHATHVESQAIDYSAANESNHTT